MGKKSVVQYANFDMGYHGKHTLIPKSDTNITLLRFLINNHFGVFYPVHQAIQDR